MDANLLINTVVIVAFIMGTTAQGSPDKAIIESVRQMERELGVTIVRHIDLDRSVQQAEQIPLGHSLIVSNISPDGTAYAWSSYPNSVPLGQSSFLMVRNLKEGVSAVRLEGRIAGASSVSTEAEVIVALAVPIDPSQRRKRELLAIDRRSNNKIYDMTGFVTEFGLGNNITDIRVSGPGTLVALATDDQIQVLEIPSGRTMYAGPGSSPRLSPDGKRLAFVRDKAVWIYSFSDRSIVKMHKAKRVKGVGGWSPDGRFLLAGAWIRPMLFAFDKRQIIIDVKTGEYAIIGNLYEGDYGGQYEWVSTKLSLQ
jgi:plasmid stability protein